MNVELTPGQRALIKQAIDNGRITRKEQVIEEAMALWEYRERRRLEINAMVERWRDVGRQGSKDECLACITDFWTDMRPSSISFSVAARHHEHAAVLR